MLIPDYDLTPEQLAYLAHPQTTATFKVAIPECLDAGEFLEVYYFQGDTLVEVSGEFQNGDPWRFAGEVGAIDILNQYIEAQDEEVEDEYEDEDEEVEVTAERILAFMDSLPPEERARLAKEILERYSK